MIVGECILWNFRRTEMELIDTEFLAEKPEQVELHWHLG